MKRRSFLAMLGLAPVAAVTAKAPEAEAEVDWVGDGAEQALSLARASISEMSVGTIQVEDAKLYIDTAQLNRDVEEYMAWTRGKRII